MAKQMPVPLSRADVQTLIELIKKNDIQEFELEQGDLKLKIVASRAPVAPAQSQPQMFASMPFYPPSMMYPPPGSPSAAAAPASAPPAASVSAPAAPVVSTPSAPAKSASDVDEDDPRYKKVTSPMVGTFYRAPAPDAKSYVEVGSRVEEDTVLCIVEAMKLMNEIKAEMRGVVKKVLTQNAQPIEYGQALFLIEPL